MKLKYILEAVDLLYEKWDLGKKRSQAKGKICAWIYLMEILEESETIITKSENSKLIGFCGYTKFDSKKHFFRKRFFNLLKRLLLISPTIKNKKAISDYYNDYSYTPNYLKDYFDGEISIAIIDKSYRGKELGRKMLEEIFELARKDNIKKLQILTDNSCNFKFYEKIGCKKIYETKVYFEETDDCNKFSENCYIYEKNLIKY